MYFSEPNNQPKNVHQLTSIVLFSKKVILCLEVCEFFPITRLCLKNIIIQSTNY
jgi:hypothetical protein